MLDELDELDEFEEFDEFEEVEDGLVLLGLTTWLELEDAGLGVATTGLCVGVGEFLSVPTLPPDLLICPKAESEIVKGIMSSSVFIRARF